MTGSYPGGSASPRRLTPLAALVAASGISSLGMAATLVAVPWFVLHSTGSGTRTGLVATAEVLGLLCSAVLAGPVVDRLPVRAASVGADLLATAAISLIPLLHAWDALNLPVLTALVFLVGAARGPSDTSKQLLLPAAMQRAGVTAERATGCVEGARRIGMMAGAPLAGLLIATAAPYAPCTRTWRRWRCAPCWWRPWLRWCRGPVRPAGRRAARTPGNCVSGWRSCAGTGSWGRWWGS